MWQDVMEFYADEFNSPARKLDSEYLIITGGIPVRFKVFEEMDGSFTGICQYNVQGPRCAGPYGSSRREDTPADALMDAMKGFFNFLSPGAKLTDRWGDSDEVIIYKPDYEDD